MNVRKFTCMTAATIVGLSLSFGATSPVHSAQPVVVEGQRYFDPEIQRVVHYADLNLSDASGQKLLIRRVDYAVNDLCAGNQSWRPLEANLAIRQCSKSAWASANPQITAAFERGKSGGYIAATAVTITVPR